MHMFRTDDDLCPVKLGKQVVKRVRAINSSLDDTKNAHTNIYK